LHTNTPTPGLQLNSEVIARTKLSFFADLSIATVNVHSRKKHGSWGRSAHNREVSTTHQVAGLFATVMGFQRLEKLVSARVVAADCALMRLSVEFGQGFMSGRQIRNLRDSATDQRYRFLFA
jgi:hypothetical protein